MPNGESWQVTGEMTARAWAANRARRAAREGEADPQAIFQQEYDRTRLSDDTLLLERATQLYWIDVEGEATHMRQPEKLLPPSNQWAYERERFLEDKRIVA